MKIALIVFIVLIALLELGSCTDNSSGFNSVIKWVRLKAGLKRARELNKPAAILIHKTYALAEYLQLLTQL